jgi:hypothetical protein
VLPSLARSLGRLERQRAELLAVVGRLGPAQLAFRPAPESWNSLGVIEHLVQVESRILGGLPTRPGPLPLGQRLGATARLALLTLYLRAGGRVRAPTRSILPAGGVTLDELRVRWDGVRAGYASALEGFGRSDLERPMMKHPIVGKLRPVQTLAFLYNHTAHHRRQLGRIRGAPGFPP